MECGRLETRWMRQTLKQQKFGSIGSGTTGTHFQWRRVSPPLVSGAVLPFVLSNSVSSPASVVCKVYGSKVSLQGS